MLRKPSTDELEERLHDETYNLTPLMDDNKRVMRKLCCVLVLAGIFMAVEIVGGILANSIAIISDAAHMLSDLLGFVISIISVWISGLPANRQHSYGFHRAGVIGALASVIVIWALTGFLIYFAVERVIHIDEIEVEGKLMFGIACFGLFTNLVMVKVLHGDHGHDHGHGHSHGGHSHSHGLFGHSHEHDHAHDHKHGHEHSHDHDHAHNHDHKHDHGHHDHAHAHDHSHDHKHDHLTKAGEGHQQLEIATNPNKVDVKSKKNLSRPSDSENLNVRATIIHILGDILQSIGVIIASILVWINPEKMKIADPIITFIFAVIVLITTLRVVKDCIFVLMEGTPSEINLEEFEQDIATVEGVVEVHDLHVWSLGVGKPSMSAHIYTDRDTGAVLKKVTKLCRTYGIYHSTIQVETTQDKAHIDYIECAHNIH